MRVSIVRCAVAAVFLTNLFASCLDVHAQSLGGSPPTGGLVTGPDSGPGAVPGGAALADFGSLISLIEMTIDPDDWQNAGGTNSIQPYPAGVYVDPTGQMKRISTARLDARIMGADSNGPRHPWRSDAKQRTISLQQLDAAVGAARRLGIRPSLELQRLAGLSRIEYVKVDAANEDILLAGPAGSSFGFLLEDLAVVAALINHQTEPLGCSIEPSDAGILAAQQMLSNGDTVQQLARAPQAVVEQMQATIGPHNVRVFGMNAQTGTAIALIDADEHMKRVGFGTVATAPRIRSYFDFLDRQASVPEQSLIRWWFAYTGAPIVANAQRDLFQLPEQCVRVMSEQQWISGQGRAPTGKQDPAADAFAEEISQHMAELRASNESYARLSAVFETALALQLGLEATGQPSFDAWFPNLCGLGKQDVAEVVEPKTVEGLTTWHKLNNGTIVAVVSGGVKVDSRSLAAREQWQESKLLTSSVVARTPIRPSSAHANWWWD